MLFSPWKMEKSSHWFTGKATKTQRMCEEISGDVSRDLRLIPETTAQRRVRPPEQLLTYLGNRFFDYPDHLCNRFCDFWSLRSSVLCSDHQIDENARARPSEGRPAQSETGNPHAFAFVFLCCVSACFRICAGVHFRAGGVPWVLGVRKHGSHAFLVHLRSLGSGLASLWGQEASFRMRFQTCLLFQTTGRTDECTHNTHAQHARLTRTQRT